MKGCVVLFLVFFRAVVAIAGLNDGLVAYYPLDGDVLDHSGNGNDGQVQGNPTQTTGEIGGAFDFNGSSDWLMIPENLPDTDISGPFTVALWVRSDISNVGDKALVAETLSTSNHDWVLDVFQNRPRFWIRDNSQNSASVTGSPIQSGQWYHQAGIWTGSEIKLFVDGVLVGTSPAAEINRDQNVISIGARNLNSVIAFWDGAIDEVRIYDRALTASEISQLNGLPANTGSGILRLTGGTLNSTSLSPGANLIEVSSGGAISGNVLLGGVNNLDETVTTPLGYSWSWGDRQSDFTQIDADISSGLTDWDVSINLTAPAARGRYALLFAFDDTDSSTRLFSVDEAGAGPTWNDGNDLVDFGWEEMDFAASLGFVDSWSRGSSAGGLITHDLPVAPVFVDVGGVTTGSGTVFLTGGTIGGHSLSAENWHIEAEAGETLSGNITFDVENVLSSSARSPLGYSWNWGNRETDLVEIDNNINSGTTSWNVPISLSAPSVPGNYYILFGFNGAEFSISQVLSCDNWAAGGDVQWGDGNDYVDLDGLKLEYAHAYGYVPDWAYRMNDMDYSDRDIPVMPVLVHVGEGRIFADGFEDLGTGAWSRSEAYFPALLTIDLGGGVTMDLILIAPGTFEMGSPEDERGRNEGEDQHPVTLTRGYYLGKYEVTQAQWEAIMGSDPSYYSSCGSNCPVEQVSWNDVCGGTTGSDCAADSFIGKLNTYLGTTKFRLPKEAEWEYAARAGTTTEFSFDTSTNPEWDIEYGDFPQAEPYMWWGGNDTPSGTKEVGSKLPNPWGLYDMHGNVWEWVADWYDDYEIPADPDPTGPSSGTYRIKRGGRFNYWAKRCRSAGRSVNYPYSSYNYVGFRLARSK